MRVTHDPTIYSPLKVIGNSVSNAGKLSGRISRFLGGPVRQAGAFLLAPVVEIISGRAFSNLSNFWNCVKSSIVVIQLVSIITVPTQLSNIVRNAFGMKKASREKRAELALEIADDTRIAGSAVGGFVWGLMAAKAISKAATRWTVQFTGVMGILSLGTIAKYVRRCAKTYRLVQDMTKCQNQHKVDGKLTLESLKAVTKLYSDKQAADKDFIINTFGVKDQKFVDGLLLREGEIQLKLESADDNVRKEGQELLESTLKSLKGRVNKNVMSSALKALSGIINVVGTILLLAVPICPAGWILVGIGSAMEVAAIVHDSRAERVVKVDLGIEKPSKILARVKSVVKGIPWPKMPKLKMPTMPKLSMPQMPNWLRTKKVRHHKVLS